MNQTAKKKVSVELLQEYERLLVYEILLGIKGIGKGKATTLSFLYDTLESLKTATSEELLELKSKTQTTLLKKDVVYGILAAQAEIHQLDELFESPDLEIINEIDIRHKWILYLTQQFVKRQLINLKEKKLENLDINPHLTVLLGLEKEDAIKFFVLQSISRSIVTSWGMDVEKFLMYSGGEVKNEIIEGLFDESVRKKMKGSNVDVFKIIDDTIYCLQVKSGPNTMNVEMVSGLNNAMDVIDTLEVKSDREMESVSTIKSLLGMTYGKRERISAQIRDNLKDFDNRTKIGRELWAFISGDEDYYLHVLALMKLASTHFLHEDFMGLINSKVEEITTEWNLTFQGEDFKEVIQEKYL